MRAVNKNDREGNEQDSACISSDVERSDTKISDSVISAMVSSAMVVSANISTADLLRGNISPDAMVSLKAALGITKPINVVSDIAVPETNGGTPEKITETKDPNEPNEADLGRKSDILLRVAKILLKSLADNNRIERNVLRVAKYLGIKGSCVHMHITYTTVMLNVRCGEGTSITKFIKCRDHAVNMAAVTNISNLSWYAAHHKPTIDEFEDKLNAIENRKPIYPQWLLMLAAGLACGALSIVFGADIQAAAVTFIAASVGAYVRLFLTGQDINGYIVTVITSFVATMIAALSIHLHISGTPFHPIFASVVFMIPGVPMINSTDDIIDGHTLVGLTRGVIAFITLASITLGMMFTLMITDLSIFEHTELVSQSGWLIIALCAAMASTGLAILFNVPPALLPLSAIGGAIAITIRDIFIYEVGMTLPFSTLYAALAIGILAVLVKVFINAPIKVLSIPPVIPLVPGVALYKTFIGVLGIKAAGVEQLPEFFQTIESGISSIGTIVALALGITIPNIVKRKNDERRGGADE